MIQTGFRMPENLGPNTKVTVHVLLPEASRVAKCLPSAGGGGPGNLPGVGWRPQIAMWHGMPWFVGKTLW